MKIARILRRGSTLVAFLSAIAFLALAGCFIRQRFVCDEFHLLRWNPATQSITEARLLLSENGLLVHAESITALPSDDVAAIRAKVWASNLRFAHVGYPPQNALYRPYLWCDHHRST